MNDKGYWLIEKTGEARQVFGPYTLEGAKRAAGARYAVIEGSGLANGQTMPRGHVVHAVQSGRIRTADGSELS